MTDVLTQRVSYKYNLVVECSMRKIAVVGMGYVGIPIAALLADVEGFTVVGVQRRSKRSGWKIDWLNEGKNPIGGDEPGLSELIARVVKKGTFSVVESIETCRDAEAVLIDVQTPTDVNRVPKYESLREVSEAVGRCISPGTLVVIESTVAPGTTENIIKPMLEKVSGMKVGGGIFLAFCYERVMVGRLLKNITTLPRIIGGVNAESSRRAMDIYKHIVKAKLCPTNALTAEVAKTVENAYRDVNIAFANEVGLICESLGIDAFEVRELVNTLPNDPTNPASNPHRNMHYPGCGVGGHCLPKDSWLLKYGLDEYGKTKFFPRLIVTSRELNDAMPLHMADLFEQALMEKGKSIKNAKATILGIAFLENSDDTRNTPSTTLYHELVRRGATPMLHDPVVRDFDIPFSNDLNETIEGTDGLLIMTKHHYYLKLDLRKVRMQVATPILVDGRNAFNTQTAISAGFIYKGIGKNNFRHM